MSLIRYIFKKERTTKRGTSVGYEQLVAQGGSVQVSKVQMEAIEPGFVPDIVIHAGPKKLIVEIAVTHKVSREKLRRIRRRDLAAIELYLQQSDALLTRDALRQKLQHELDSKAWLFHPKQREAERIFAALYRAALRADRASKSLPPLRSNGSLRISRPKLGSSRTYALPSYNEYDRTAEQFRQRHQRYPTMAECLRLWPHLYKKR